jgi:dihydroorotate dehydrogenase (NAD+) catalytic subunit
VIELAPGHKQGCTVQNPVLLAAGSAGCGEARWPELDLRALGGLVAGPVTLQNRAGAPMPRLAEAPSGMLLETGSQNRGLSATLRTFAPLWARLGIPVVVQLTDAQPAALGRVAARLSQVKGVSALEWRVPATADAAAVARGAGAVTRAGDLPLWVKVPQSARTNGADNAPAALATAAYHNGASTIVVATPPVGAALVEEQTAWLLQGTLYGPALFAQTLHALARIAALELPVALIACGGIHTVTQARAALTAGARAIQLDSVAWIEPAFPAALAAALA